MNANNAKKLIINTKDNKMRSSTNKINKNNQNIHINNH